MRGVYRKRFVLQHYRRIMTISFASVPAAAVGPPVGTLMLLGVGS